MQICKKKKKKRKREKKIKDILNMVVMRRKGNVSIIIEMDYIYYICRVYELYNY